MGRAVVLVAVLVACGRIDFGTIGAPRDGAIGDSALRDGSATTDAASGPIMHLGAFVALGDSSPWTFSAQGSAAGDYVVFRAGCFRSGGGATPTVAISDDDGYGFQVIGSGVYTTDAEDWQVTYGAVVPNTLPVTITLTWSGSNGGACSGKAINGDEFANVDSTDPVDAFTFDGGTSVCRASLTTEHANDALWLACDVSGIASAVGSGYTLGADNDDGDWSEYRVSTDPAGTPETATMSLSGTGTEYQGAFVALAPRP